MSNKPRGRSKAKPVQSSQPNPRSSSNSNTKQKKPNTSSSPDLSTRKHTLFSPKVIKDDSIDEIIEEGSKEGTTRCKLTENMYSHIRTKKHRKNTPEDDVVKLESLIKILDGSSEAKLEKQELAKEKREKEDVKPYLEFLAFGLSKNLSFSQVSDIGSY